MQKKVTVLIPVFNAEKTLKRALDSLEAQTYKDFTVIIWNDGSTDHTRDLVISIQSKYSFEIILCNEAVNRKRGFIRNQCLQMCGTEYGMWMDADDTCEPTKIEKQLYVLERMNTNFCVTEMFDVVPKSEKTPSPITAAAINEVTEEFLMESNIIPSPTMMFRTEVAKRFKYNEDPKFDGMEDWGYLRLMYHAGSSVFCIPEPLYNYHTREKDIPKPKKIFRFDDICINTDMRNCNLLAELLKTRFPTCEIWYCISPLVSDMTQHTNDQSELQRIFPKLYNAQSDIRNFFCVDFAGVPNDIPDFVRRVNHGLFHADHRLMTGAQQELSIMAGSSLTKSNIFVPPFNKYDENTEAICERLQIQLVRFIDGWMGMEHEKFDMNKNLWYLHPRHWNVDKLIKYLGE